MLHERCERMHDGYAQSVQRFSRIAGFFQTKTRTAGEVSEKTVI